MRGFDNILVPLDFSDPSSNILSTALRAVAAEGQITLLHVVEYLPIVTESTFGVYPHRKDIEQIKDLSRRKLEAAADAFRGALAETPSFRLRNYALYAGAGREDP